MMKQHLNIIFKVQNEGRRKTIKDMVALIHTQQGLKKLGPETYHPTYSKEFLTSSFEGEPLPGVYLPCGSSLTEREATETFYEENGRQPLTIVELNGFMKNKFKPVAPVFNAQLHVSHI